MPFFNMLTHVNIKKNKEVSKYMQIRNSIRFYRKKIGLKQEELAYKIGIKRSNLSFIENGYRLPDVELLEKIALNLKTTIGQLYPIDIQDLILRYDKDNN